MQYAPPLVPNSASFLWPDRDEVVPLVEVLADGGFEGADDLLSELGARLAIAERGAIVGDGR